MSCSLFQCPSCHGVYSTQSNRKRHLNRNAACDDFMDELRCNKCPRTFNTREDLVFHFDDEHPISNSQGDSGTPDTSTDYTSLSLLTTKREVLKNVWTILMLHPYHPFLTSLHRKLHIDFMQMILPV